MFRDYQKLVFFDFETTGTDVSCDSNIGCFPIELAMMVTDCELNIIGRPISSLINWDIFKTEYFQKHWDNIPATKVHGIKLDEITDSGVLHNSLCTHPKDNIIIPHIIEMYLEELKIGNEKNDELILVSDNPYFDFTLMKKLYNVKTKDMIQFPFHYNCYSPMMLFKSLDMNHKETKTHRALGDMNHKETKAHRALGDVYSLYKSCVIAFDRLRKFDYKKGEKY